MMIHLVFHPARRGNIMRKEDFGDRPCGEKRGATRVTSPPAVAASIVGVADRNNRTLVGKASKLGPAGSRGQAHDRSSPDYPTRARHAELSGEDPLRAFSSQVGITSLRAFTKFEYPVQRMLARLSIRVLAFFHIHESGERLKQIVAIPIPVEGQRVPDRN